MKKRIRLTEGDLHRIVKESVNRVLNEVAFGYKNEPRDAQKKYLDQRRDNEDDWKEHSMDYDMTQENIEEGLGDFLDKFKRTSRAINGSPNQNFNYSPKTNKFTYYDERGNEHDTGIGYEKGKIGRNWNPFKSNGRKTNVTPHDAKIMRGRLQQWQNDNAPSITRGYRANDAERRQRAEYDASERERRRREEAELQRLSQPQGYNQFDHFSQYFGSNPLSR